MNMMQLGLTLVAYDKMSQVVDGALGRMTRGLTGIQSKVREVARQMAEFGTGASLAGNKVMEAMRTPLGAFAEQEHALAKLETVFMDSFGQVPKALMETKRQIIELGNTNPGTDAIFANTAVNLRKQGMALEDINGGALKAAAELAIILDKPSQEMAEMVGKLREGFGLAGSELPKMADIIQRTSIGFGVDPESMRYALQYAGSTMRALRMEGAENAKQFLTIQGLMQQRGVEGSVFGTNFAQMINQSGMLDTKLMRHSAIMKEVNKDLNENGIKLQFFNAQGKFAGMENFIGQLEKLKILSDQQRMTVLNRLFGMEGARTAIQLMEIGNEGLRKAYAIQDAQADITTRNNKMLGTTVNLWAAFSGTMRNLWAALGGPAVTALKPLLDAVNTFAGAEGPLAKWVHNHQELVKWLGLTVLGGGILLVTLGGLGISLSFVLRGAVMAIGGFKAFGTAMIWAFRTITLLGSGLGRLLMILGRVGWIALNVAGPFLLNFGKCVLMVAGDIGRGLLWALRAATTAFLRLGMAMLANPIGLIIAGIAAIAAGAYLIWRNWDTLKVWFSSFWNWLKGQFAVIMSGFSNLGQGFRNAGVMLIKSLIQGIKSMGAGVYDTIKGIFGKAAKLLNHSDAKEGPFSQITKNGMAIMTTLSKGVKIAAPALRATMMASMASAQMALAPAMALAVPQTPPALATPRAMSGQNKASGPGITINFSPQITINGQADGQGGNIKDQVLAAMRTHEHELVKIVEDVQRRYARRGY